MKAKKADSLKMPFPKQRPRITITELDQEPFVVDSPELRWWIVLPVIGDVAMTARYIPPDWSFDGALRMRAERPARIHGVEGIEVDVDGWDDKEGWQSADWSMCARQDEKTTQYLANLSRHDKERNVNTFLEEGFGEFWGQMERQLEGKITDPEAPLDVNYVTREGRTVLKRSYCQDCFDNIEVDKEEEMVVDGVSLFLWEDILTGLAIGV